MARQPESREVKKILAYLRKKGGRWVKIHGGDNPFQEVGIPDILGCYRGYAVAIEAKTPAGHMSVKQTRFLKQWSDAGGYILIATNVHEVASLLAKIDRRSDG
jgi:Holliday junction resolvase